VSRQNALEQRWRQRAAFPLTLGSACFQMIVFITLFCLVKYGRAKLFAGLTGSYGNQIGQQTEFGQASHWRQLPISLNLFNWPTNWTMSAEQCERRGGLRAIGFEFNVAEF